MCETYDLDPVSLSARPAQDVVLNIPGDLPVVNFHLALQERVSRIPAKIISATCDPVSKRVRLSIGFEDSVYFSIVLMPRRNVKRDRGAIALIIDDFGDRWDSFTRSFTDLGIPFTASVLPGRKNSTLVARGLAERGCEVILHLPMEPVSARFPRDEYTILSTMGRADILRIIQRSLDQVPAARGMNNHMGSKVTQNAALMEVILTDIHNRGLFFVDSRTTAKTEAYRVAKRIQMPCTKRDVFLDTEMDEATIARQLWKLAEKAEKKGHAVGIGHARSATLRVLQREIEKIQAKGFDFVFISDVL